MRFRFCRVVWTFAAVSLAVPMLAWGWGSGHNDVAKLCARHMPSDIKNFLGVWNDRLEWWCHYPDMTEIGWGTRRFMEKADLRREIGDAAGIFLSWGFDRGNWFHGHRGRAVTFVALKDAFRRGDPKTAAFCFSVLGHVVADQGAINHTPILQFTTYSKFDGIDYGWKNNCEFTLGQAPVAALLEKELAAYRPRRLAATFAEAVSVAVLDCYAQSEVAAEAEIAAAFGTKDEHAAAMTKIVSCQLRSLLDMVWTAWSLRNEPFELSQGHLDGIRVREETRIRQTDVAKQAVYHGLFDSSLNPPQPKATIGFVLEPYGSFHVRSLSYVGKMLGAAYARTLRDAGYAVKGIPIWSLERERLPSPQEMAAVVVFPGAFTNVSRPVAEALRAYREAGGRLIWIGGADPQDVTGFRAQLVRRADEEVPVSSKWAIQNEDVWQKMKVTFANGFCDVSGQVFGFVRNPNFDGFCKPYCGFEITRTANTVPLVELDNGSACFCVGARRGNAVWLPEYLFLPFLFSGDRTVRWEDMRLDSFAARVGLAAVGDLP